MSISTYREAITSSMHQALSSNPNSLVYGLGVTDHIGIFGTTKGLEESYGSDRVFDTPISEDSMTGFAIGASLAGLYPIHIHIRADFLLLAMNQIVNSIAKYRYMYGGEFEVPMLIRAVIGRSWGQGAQHSQSLQSLFAHIPGLTVIMPSSADSINVDYNYAVNKYRNPVISLEHRLLYEYKFRDSDNIPNRKPFWATKLRSGNAVTIVATSIMVQESMMAANYVKEQNGIDVEVIDLNCVSQIDKEMILKSVSKTRHLIVVDSSWASYGVCAEVSRVILEYNPTILDKPVINLSIAESTCPTSKGLENMFYHDVGNIVESIYHLHSENNSFEGFKDTNSIKDRFNNFKGPF